MVIWKERLAALVFLLLSAGYWLMAGDIELFYGDDLAPFNARSLPSMLGIAGVILSCLSLGTSLRSGTSDDVEISSPDRRWGKVALVIVAMIGFGALLRPAGFLIATTAFLIVTMLILGERRWWILVVLPAGLAATFEWLLTGVLGIYLDDPFLNAMGLVS